MGYEINENDIKLLLVIMFVSILWVTSIFPLNLLRVLTLSSVLKQISHDLKLYFSSSGSNVEIIWNLHKVSLALKFGIE